MRWCVPCRHGSPHGVLSLEGKIVSDHGDKFAVRRFSLDAADGVAEVALEGFDVAAIPGDLDGMKGLRPSGGGWLAVFAGCSIGLFIGLRLPCLSGWFYAITNAPPCQIFKPTNINK